ncbi:PGF-CTERM sorting domain-containing protein [Halodesulfurarchaeum sp. HSR-GB]|uniref:DUF7345 domain-containing protein n=1 Tax=Halodesulfurarchaeum sp. HSR-GB TaxID=3074077 RepID=UPI002857183E|nr:PGF-CTERM sorting domain-containing protein [Halodesulfurarchaeum sp. HSR-GB]MDR5657174.1 PGF-CTERM sorting domain-containing protein [Halodesulfurarchaeum sp. HSR-GB]
MTTDSRWANAHRVGTITLAITLVLSLGIGSSVVAAQEAPTEPSVVVDIEADGTGDLTLVHTRDLTSDAETQAFESISQNETTRAAVEARFADRMGALAGSISTAVDRDVTVSETSIDLATTQDGETGVIRLSATIEGLALVDGDRLVLTEPFASGFSADRPIVVHVPADYTVEEAQPTPDAQDGTTLEWAAGADVTDFELELTADSSATETPGFGFAAASIALLGAALLGYRRR